jgi:hypothetical protein
VYKRLYIGPHLMLANTQRGSSPPLPVRSGEEDRSPETAAGPVLLTQIDERTRIVDEDFESVRY